MNQIARNKNPTKSKILSFIKTASTMNPLFIVCFEALTSSFVLPRSLFEAKTPTKEVLINRSPSVRMVTESELFTIAL